MSVSQSVTQNQCFIQLRKEKEETDMELLEEILNQNNLMITVMDLDQAGVVNRQ